MAKKETRSVHLPATIAELRGDPENPRAISDGAIHGLEKSMSEFGDISGITFNRRTGELVTGHQRVARIRERWGDQLSIDAVDAEHGAIRSPEGHVFRVRFVDWSKPRQRAANVAANSEKITGEFTDDLDEYLSEIREQIEEETPGLLDDLMLDEYLAEQTVGQQSASIQNIAEQWQVIIECDDETHQREVFERLVAEGLRCKLLVI